MTSRLQSASTSRSLSTVLPSLTLLMMDCTCREIFDNSGGIGCIARHLRVRQSASYDESASATRTQAAASVQQLYELCYCLWLLSFDVNTNERIRNHFHRDGAVPRTVELVAASPREKVVRLAIATLVHLAQCREPATTTKIIRDTLSKRIIDGKLFLQEMIGCGLVKTVDLLKQKEILDVDFSEGMVHVACPFAYAYSLSRIL